jgi:virulence-associated protein VagC
MDKPETAKLFMNGRSQAVRLPAKYRFKGTEVLVNRVGNNVVLSPNRIPGATSSPRPPAFQRPS